PRTSTRKRRAPSRISDPKSRQLPPLTRPHSLLRIAHPPPRSPLLPYTTLFRSEDASFPEPTLIQVGANLKQLDEGLIGVRPGEQDRKSTRLNSSHEWSSYAVFCLKKKKVQHEYSSLLSSPAHWHRLRSCTALDS